MTAHILRATVKAARGILAHGCRACGVLGIALFHGTTHAVPLSWLGVALVIAPLSTAPGPLLSPDSVPVISLEGRTPRHFVGRTMELLEDPDGRLDFRSVSTGAHAWFHAPELVPNFTFTNSTYWVRFKAQ